MKKSFRALSALLCLFLAAAAFGGCSKDENNGSSSRAKTSSQSSEDAVSESETGSGSESAIESGSEASGANSAGASVSSKGAASKSGSSQTKSTKKTKNLKGRKIGLMVSKEMFPHDSAPAQFNERVTKHLDAIEKDFNCTLELLPAAGEGAYEAAMAAGAYYADITVGPAYKLKPWIRQGWVKAISDLGIDTNQGKFLNSYRKMMKYDKKDYALNFTSWYTQILYLDEMLLYNKSLFDRLKLADPQKLIEKNQWSWAAFKDISKKFASQGKGYYGSTGLSPASPSIWSTGARTVMWDSKAKKWVFGYKGNTAVFDAMNWAMEIWHYDKTYLPLMQDWTANSYQVFNVGKSAFLIGELNWVGYGFYKNMEDDYALIPFPTQSGKPHAVGRLGVNTQNYFIPGTAKDAGDVALVFDRWTEPLPGTTASTWEEEMLENVWRGNKNSMKWYTTMLGNAESDSSMDLGHPRYVTLINALTAVVKDRSMTGAEAVDSITERMTAFIDEYINSDPKMNLEH